MNTFFTKITKVTKKVKYDEITGSNYKKTSSTPNISPKKQAGHAEQFFIVRLISFCQYLTHFSAKSKKMWFFHVICNIKIPEKHTNNYLGRRIAAVALICIVLFVFYRLHWETAHFRRIFAKLFQKSTFLPAKTESIFTKITEVTKKVRKRKDHLF